jgi:hypothetical protein
MGWSGKWQSGSPSYLLGLSLPITLPSSNYSSSLYFSAAGALPNVGEPEAPKSAFRHTGRDTNALLSATAAVTAPSP